MNHLVIVPIILPLLGGAILLLMNQMPLSWRRAVSLVLTLALVVIGVVLVKTAQQGVLTVYALGNWLPPFGIVLVLDRLAALLLTLTAFVASCALLYASGREDTQGPYFHALFQFQLLGLNGAFLTGDLFNLFVFFEILLIASYTLLLHGHGSERSRAGVHVVALNVVGSALFLLAVGTLYGVTGTLNMADLARIMPMLGDDEAGIARAGGLLLLVVLALKSAVLPLSFWLPQAYASATASVAALFALMTKVGVYSIMRIYTQIFDADAGLVSDLARPWVLPAALGTLAFGVFGLLATRSLRRMVAWLVLVSVGTLLTVVGSFSEAGLAAAVYYLTHSTLVTAALFLLADTIRRQRVMASDDLNVSEPVAQPALLGALFLIAAATITGLPPFSGFVGKLLILQALHAHEAAIWSWSVILIGSVLTVMFVARAGSFVFWKVGGEPSGGACAPAPAIAAIVLLLGANAALVVCGSFATEYARASAQQLSASQEYERAVLQLHDESRAQMLERHRRSLR